MAKDMQLQSRDMYINPVISDWHGFVSDITHDKTYLGMTINGSQLSVLHDSNAFALGYYIDIYTFKNKYAVQSCKAYLDPNEKLTLGCRLYNLWCAIKRPFISLFISTKRYA